MSVQLRDYQQDLTQKIYNAWNSGYKNVLGVMPCRSGKTITFTNMSVNDPNPSCAIVHRQELIGQISESHALLQVPHNIIAPQKVIDFCIDRQIRTVGRSLFDPKAPATIAGVDTLIRRFEPGEYWCRSVQRTTTDEAHHVRQENKWGKGMEMFPNAFGLGVTATPIRGDGKSLHFEQGGMFHALIQGIGMRDLIERGSVCDYRVVAPKPSIQEAELKIGSTGEFTDKSVRKAAHKSEIVGDSVRTYTEHTPGKQAIAFCVDVEQADLLAARFRTAGVRAKSLDGTTPDAVRQKVMDEFKAGQIQVLTNCDLFSEGLDLPGVDVCIMARPTNSFGMFVQQFCRPLTPAPDKTFGIIIDQVGNVLRMAARFGMPDTPRIWELWREEGQRKKREPDAIPHRACENCLLTYECTQLMCPYCGAMYEPANRGVPAEVDGILAEMSPQLLAQLRAAKAEVWDERGPKIRPGASDGEIGRQHQNFVKRQMAHNMLTEAMRFWGGVELTQGYTDSQMQARFLHRFGVDVMTAQTLNTAQAIALTEEINKTLT